MHRLGISKRQNPPITTPLNSPLFPSERGELFYIFFPYAEEINQKSGLWFQMMARVTSHTHTIHQDNSWPQDIERLRPWLLSLAIALTQRQDLAQDVTQQSILRALQAKKPPLDHLAQKAFLRTIITRVTIDQLKKDPPPLSQPSLSTDPTTPIAVQQTLQKLEPHHRVVLALTFAEELSYAEIAEALQIPIGTVASRIHSAKKAFRKLWEDQS